MTHNELMQVILVEIPIKSLSDMFSTCVLLRYLSDILNKSCVIKAISRQNLIISKLSNVCHLG